MIGLTLILLVAAPASSPTPIEVPPEVMPAWATYKRCVEDHFRERMLSVHNPEEAGHAWSASVGDCHDVRIEQVARALEARVDPRIYGDRENLRTIVHRAFDRFDAELNMEWNRTSPEHSARAEDQ